MDQITASLRIFDGFDYVVLILNFLMFLFATAIVRRTGSSSDEAAITSRAYTLRAANVILFVLYVSAIFVSQFAIQLYETGLTLLLAVLVTHFFDTLILRRYGRTRTIDDVEYRTGFRYPDRPPPRYEQVSRSPSDLGAELCRNPVVDFALNTRLLDIIFLLARLPRNPIDRVRAAQLLHPSLALTFVTLGCLPNLGLQTLHDRVDLRDKGAQFLHFRTVHRQRRSTS